MIYKFRAAIATKTTWGVTEVTAEATDILTARELARVKLLKRVSGCRRVTRLDLIEESIHA